MKYAVIKATTTRTVNLKSKLGEVQTMSFSPDIPPPFYACDAPKSDMMGRKARDKRTNQISLEPAGGGIIGETEVELGILREGLEKPRRERT